MKKTLLKRRSAFIIISIMFSATTQAQIVYTDVNPDQTITGTYNLDLNNDGTTDFTISHTTMSGCGTYHRIQVTPAGSNQVIDNGTDAIKMAVNTLINSASTTWSSTANQKMATYINIVWKCYQPARWVGSGQWYNATTVDGYLGLKLIKNGSTYFGWVRISSLTQAHGFIVKDYAYDSTPNHSILAGATSGVRLAFMNGNEKDQNNSISVFPNPASDKITMNISALNSKNVDVKINDLMGKIVFSHQYNLENGNASVEIDIADLSRGMYLIQIQNTGFSKTRKLLVVK